MNRGKFVFSQLLDFIDKDVFLIISNKYEGNKYVKHFTCWNQLAVLMFGQLIGIVLEMWYLRLRPIGQRLIIWDSARLQPRVTSQRPKPGETTEYSRNLPIGS